MLIKAEVLGIMIKNLREKANLTQKDLADKLSISFQAVSKWEKGECYPDLSQVVALSESFKVPLNQLLVEKTETELEEKKLYRVYETISSYRVDIEMLDFRISGDTIIKLKVHNKSEKNITINPKMFLLMADGDNIVKASQSPIMKYNYSTDDDELTGTKYKHEIPEFIPPHKDGIIVLYFEHVYDTRHVNLYPSLDESLTNYYFTIPRVFYEGIQKPNWSSYKDAIDIENCIDFFLAKKLEDEIINMVVFQSINYEIISSQRRINNSEISYSKNDGIIKKLFNDHIAEIERRCEDNAVKYKQFIIQKHSFMDEGTIRFVSKMWLKHGNIVLEWTIPYLDSAWVTEMKSELLLQEPQTIQLLIKSKSTENMIHKLMVEKMQNYSVDKIIQFIKLAKGSLSNEFIQELLMSKEIDSIEDLRRVKPYLDEKTFDDLRTNVIKRIV
jgi:transcriptional regulator with XRE-family HTH domain